MRKPLLWTGCGLVVVGVALLLRPAPITPTHPSAITAARPAAVAGDVSKTVATATALPSVPELALPAATAEQLAAVRHALQAGSLRDTEVDGEIALEADGRVRLDLQLRRWFDYHLSVIGEASPQAIRAYLAEELARTRPPHVQAQVLAALDRYLQYLAAIDQMAAQLGPADADRRDAWLRQLRRQVLGEALSQGFFGEEEAYADFRQRRAELAQRSELSEGEREQLLQQAVDDLPTPLREALQQQQRSSAELELAMQISSSELDPQARFAARAQAFGEEAAARLELADREQSHWQAQLASDRQMRSQLAERAGLDDAQRQQQLQQWRALHLDEGSRQRIEALEAIGQLPEG